MESKVKAELLEESADFGFIQTCETGTLRECVLIFDILAQCVLLGLGFRECMLIT